MMNAQGRTQPRDNVFTSELFGSLDWQEFGIVFQIPPPDYVCGCPDGYFGQNCENGGAISTADVTEAAVVTAPTTPSTRSASL